MLKTRQIASHQGHNVRTSLIVICFDTHKELRWYRRMLLSLKTLFNLFASFLLYAIAIDREPDKEEGTSWGWRRSNHLYQLIYLYGANNCCVVWVCGGQSLFLFRFCFLTFLHMGKLFINNTHHLLMRVDTRDTAQILILLSVFKWHKFR